MILAILLLLSGLTISAVAIYYSVMGLMAIFSAAAIPIMVMGISLEVGKLVTASWVKQHWAQLPILMKSYALVAVTILMIITSLGIFGFLSKAHSDQTLVSGDVQSKLAIYDEKIKTARENIETDRRQLKQMDEAVDQVMARSTDEKGADKANAVRKSQQKDRVSLAKDIETNQKTISQLNDEAAPIRAENRKVEAEVGPIKYIAAFIYGSDPDASILEKAVTWVIILIVVVFDPLAVVMLLAAQMTFGWLKEEKDTQPTIKEVAAYEADDGPLSDKFVEEVQVSAPKPTGNVTTTSSLFEASDDTLDPCYKCGTPLIIAPGIGPFCPNRNCDVRDATSGKSVEFVGSGDLYKPDEEPAVEPATISEPTIPLTKEAFEAADDMIPEEPAVIEEPQMIDMGNGYIEFNGKLFHSDSFYSENPHLKPVADHLNPNAPAIGFGDSFPNNPLKGNMFVRVDYLPTRVYKYNGGKWIQVDKDQNSSITYNDSYIDLLIEKISTGEYDPDLLSESERDQLEKRILKK